MDIDTVWPSLTEKLGTATSEAFDVRDVLVPEVIGDDAELVEAEVGMLGLVGFDDVEAGAGTFWVGVVI